MKPTKKPKRVKLHIRRVDAYVSSYKCPTCRIQYEGGGPKNNVIRFRCQCGQELIVDQA